MVQVMRWIGVAAALVMIQACRPTPQPFDRSAQAPQYQTGYTLPGAPSAMPMETPMPDTHLPPVSRVVKVGFLAPLSGASAPVGEALRDAGVLALFDKYSALTGPAAGVRVELIPKDTKGTPEGARQAAAEAVNEGAELIIGPLFSGSVEAIKPLAKTGKISILSFSNNKAVAGNGVYTLGFDPEEQAKRVAQYTFMRDVNRIGVLAPNDPYGRQVVKSVQSVANLLGRDVKPVVSYAPSGTSISQDVRNFAMEGSVGARLQFEALFLPEGGDKLGPILNALAENNINPKSVQFIGTGVWDDRDLIRLYPLDGAWLASSPPEFYRAFEERFMNTYSYKPPRIASLAYDAVALAATLATSGNGFSTAAITDPSGYSAPANGIFRFKSNGTVERGLAIMEVSGGQFKVIDPAPVSFAQ